MTENVFKGAIHKIISDCNGWGKRRSHIHVALDIMAPLVLYIAAKMFFFSVGLISSLKAALAKAGG